MSPACGWNFHTNRKLLGSKLPTGDHMEVPGGWAPKRAQKLHFSSLIFIPVGLSSFWKFIYILHDITYKNREAWLKHFPEFCELLRQSGQICGSWSPDLHEVTQKYRGQMCTCDGIRNGGGAICGTELSNRGSTLSSPDTVRTEEKELQDTQPILLEKVTEWWETSTHLASQVLRVGKTFWVFQYLRVEKEFVVPFPTRHYME